MRISLICVHAAIFIYATRLCALEIAPVEEALTLAQFSRTGQVHTVLVLSDDDSAITGIDISAKTGSYPDDSFDLVRDKGYKALAQYAQLDLPQLTIPYEKLLPSSGVFKHHIGVGINYPEHGEETAIEPEPFLFPKIAHGTGSRGFVTTELDELLDYEVELCARFDQDIHNLEDIKTAMVGLFLCGDFTDRATLMRLIDTADIQSGIGFSDAKSKPGFFPTGPYLVVPRNGSNFLDKIRLQLSVNGEPRQDSSVNEMILAVDKLAAKALETGTQTRWQYNGVAVSLLPDKMITKGTALLTGTPQGVIFRPPSTGYKLRNILKYFFTGGFFKVGPKRYVIEEYIKDSLHNKNYLQPGDSVSLRATYLGDILVVVSTPR